MSAIRAKERGPQHIYKDSLVRSLLVEQLDYELTAVIDSMHSTNGSEVRYRESDSEYSFHICPKRFCDGPIVW